ncbi:redox-sensing transcriptional repressor Rex [Patulibacter sp.]|uniref:redox-sensing transcriptional repressor Rex n=1 Tax=Patulibacter sp. TaxID=1912859 RepID=UPI0027190E1B|nr:redox-sensing transcriptional repressor Rex [Patulibacter sp.]MDO9410045.1 redox-sensing transcriptional repressor Rex [Patulibacter sp.]
MPAPPIEVVVFLRDGCHLCADALADLEVLREQEPFTVRTVDIERDDRLHARYLERIPVVAVAGEELCDFAVDAGRVLSAVRDVQARRAAVGGAEGVRGSSTATPLSAVAARRIAAQPLRPIARPAAPVIDAGDVVTTTEIESDAPAEPVVPEVRLGVGQAERLSRYLQTLTQARKMGRGTMSSQELSAHTHVNSTQIRRDLSGFGRFGKRGVGYDVEELVVKIRSILHTSTHVGIVLLGAGHLGRAIAGSDVFADHGFDVVAVLDNDPGKIGTPIGDLTIGDVRHLVDVVRENEVVVGVIASPAKAAQSLADELVDAGVQIIFNYSGTLLRTPPEVTVHTSSPAVDLLHALYYYLA